MPSYDMHRHLWPDELVERMRERAAPPCLDGDVLRLAEGDFVLDLRTYGVEACLRGLDATGTDIALVSCPPTLGIELLPEDEAEPLLAAYHRGALDAVESAGGRLLALAMGRPTDGFVGTSISAAAFDDLEELAPVLDEIVRRNSFAFVHPGPVAPEPGAPPWWSAIVDYTAQMQRAYAIWLAHGCERWPDLRIVFAILAGGAPFQLERMRARGGDDGAALHPNIYLDTASYGRRALELCFDTFGAARLLYGSDAPVIDAELSLEPIRAFGPATMEALCTNNPAALLV